MQNEEANPLRDIVQKDEEERFLFVVQSQGGVFKTPFRSIMGSSTNLIGTYDCWNCVCVYIPLDEETCFVAHIDAWSCPPSPEQRNSDMVPPKGSEDDLKNCVKNVLIEKVFPFIPTGGLGKEMKSRAIILNMRPTVLLDGVSTSATGTYIVAAIQELFDLHGIAEVQHAFGFVVNHVTADTEYFKWNGDEPAPTSKDYDEFEQYQRSSGEKIKASLHEMDRRQYPPDWRKLYCDRTKEWRFGYEEGRWYGKKEGLSKGHWTERDFI